MCVTICSLCEGFGAILTLEWLQVEMRPDVVLHDDEPTALRATDGASQHLVDVIRLTVFQLFNLVVLAEELAVGAC